VLTAEGFGKIFVKNIACRFGLLTSIISDRDPRWTSRFWSAVSKFLKTKMAMSSSHHPQHLFQQAESDAVTSDFGGMARDKFRSRSLDGFAPSQIAFESVPKCADSFKIVLIYNLKVDRNGFVFSFWHNIKCAHVT
jgi:hypothetical protein